RVVSGFHSPTFSRRGFGRPELAPPGGGASWTSRVSGARRAAHGCPCPGVIAMRAVKVRYGENGCLRSRIAQTRHRWSLRAVEVIADREYREDVTRVLANERACPQAEGGIIWIIGERPAEDLVKDRNLGRTQRINWIRIDECLERAHEGLLECSILCLAHRAIGSPPLQIDIEADRWP